MGIHYEKDFLKVLIIDFLNYYYFQFRKTDFSIKLYARDRKQQLAQLSER